MKLTKSKLKEMIRKEMNEAKREIGGYYLMKQLKDLAQDAKRGGERKVHKALMYLHDRINQSYRDVDLNARDVQDIFNDPRGRKYSKDMPDWMIDSLFESDLPTTTKKDKTVTVVHKTSGKELVVTDTPSTRKKYKRMDYFAQADPRKIKKALRIAKKMGGDMTGAIKKIERIEKDLSNNHEVTYALKTANESINEAGMFDDYYESINAKSKLKETIREVISEALPIKIKDLKKIKKVKPEPDSAKGTYNSTATFSKHHAGSMGAGDMGTISEPDTYDWDDSGSEPNQGGHQVNKDKKKRGYEPVREGMFDDYHKLNRAYMDDFIKNYKKLNRKNVVKKKGDDIYGFRKGEREAHWKYDDNFKLHYDIDKAKALGLINFFNRAKKDHPWS